MFRILSFLLMMGLSASTLFSGASTTLEEHSNCRVKILNVASRILEGQIVLESNGKVLPGTNAEVFIYELQNGRWGYFSEVKAVSDGYFTLLDIPPGKYLLIAKLSGFDDTKTYIRVRERKSEGSSIIIPLRVGGCAYSRFRK